MQSAGIPPEQTAPVNIEAEMEILRYMLHEDGADAIEAVREVLTENSFYNTSHGRAFSTMVQCHAAGVPVDDFTATEWQGLFEETPKISDMPAPRYFEELRASAPSGSPENALYYAQQVKDKEILRSQGRELSEIVKGIYTDVEMTSTDVSGRIQNVAGLHPIIEEEPEPSDQESAPFPTIKQDLLNEYMSLFDGVTEAPKSYHALCFAAAVGMMLGRRIHIYCPHEIYPNLFVLLIGRPGIDRKDTAIRYGRKLAKQLDNIQTLPAISSYEGLLQAMANAPEDNTTIEANRTLVTLSEFNALLKKARVDSTSNLIPNLCELYDTPPEAQSPTKVNPVKVDTPFLSIVSAIQPGIIEEAFRSGDIHSGFAGRWMYVLDQSTESIPWPKKLDATAWNGLVKRLSGIRDLSIDRKSTEITLADDARLMWDEFYRWHRAQNAESEILATLTERITEQVIKLGMIFAVLDDVAEICSPHLEDAIAIGKWLMGNVRQLFHDYGTSDVEKAERRIQAVLKQGARTRREVQQRCRNVSAADFKRAVDNLIGAGIVDEAKRGKRKELRLSV